MPTGVTDLARVFKAAGDPARLRILAMLERGPLCVCQLIGGLGLSQPAVSKHVGILIRAGLVAGTRRGRWLICRLATDRLPPPVRAGIRQLLAGTRRDPEILRALRAAARSALPGLPTECLT